MTRVLLYFILFVLLLPSCSKSTNSSVRVVKPKYHHRWYDRKKDKRTKRTKTIRVKN